MKPLLVVIHDDAAVRTLLACDLRARFAEQYDLDEQADGDAGLDAVRGHLEAGRQVAAVFCADSSACGGAAFRTALRDLDPHLPPRAPRRPRRVEQGASGRDGDADRAGRVVHLRALGHARALALPAGHGAARGLGGVAAAAVEAGPPDRRGVGAADARAARSLLRGSASRYGFYAPELRRPGSRRRRWARRADAAGARASAAAVLVDPTLRAHRDGARLLDGAGGRRATTSPSSAPARPGSPRPCTAPPKGSRRSSIDAALPGGQAGTSSRIRNYLGFPTGLSGRDLTNRALEQAWFFGARLVLSRRGDRQFAPARQRVRGSSSTAAARSTARTVVVATGVSWRRLDVPSLEALHGAGVFYGAAASDAAPVEGADVFIVGAGNSAGQAAVHLARSAATVTLVVRGDRLGASMSDYLVRAARADPNIRIRLRTEVVGARGEPAHGA